MDTGIISDFTVDGVYYQENQKSYVNDGIGQDPILWEVRINNIPNV